MCRIKKLGHGLVDVGAAAARSSKVQRSVASRSFEYLRACKADMIRHLYRRARQHLRHPIPRAIMTATRRNVCSHAATLWSPKLNLFQVVRYDRLDDGARAGLIAVQILRTSQSRLGDELNPVTRDDITRLCEAFDSKFKAILDAVPVAVGSAIENSVRSTVQSTLQGILPSLKDNSLAAADADDEMDVDRTVASISLPKNHRPRGSKPPEEHVFKVHVESLYA